MFGRNVRNLIVTVVSFSCTFLLLSLWPVTSDLVGDCTLGKRRFFLSGVESSAFRISTAKLIQEYLSNKIASSLTLAERINSRWLEQDDACILRLIRQKFLFKPRRRRPPSPEVDSPSGDQTEDIVSMFKDQNSGTFVEYGVLGESRTEHFDQRLDWQGLLIAKEPHHFAELRKRRRNSWIVPACLSTNSRPRIAKLSSAQTPLNIRENVENRYVQCFALYSVLLAWNRTTIDFLSLSIEENERSILSTLPWDSIHIRVVSIDHHGDSEELGNYMGQQGYTTVDHPNSRFKVFVRN